MRVVLDTSVLISALVFPGSKPDQILSRIRRGEIDLFISPFILAELDRVLREKFRFSKKEAAVLVKAIRSMAHLVEPAERITLITAKREPEACTTLTGGPVPSTPVPNHPLRYRPGAGFLSQDSR